MAVIERITKRVHDPTSPSNRPRSVNLTILSKLIEEVVAWQENRNKHHTKANRQFITQDARVKLKRLCPSF